MNNQHQFNKQWYILQCFISDYSVNQNNMQGQQNFILERIVGLTIVQQMGTDLKN